MNRLTYKRFLLLQAFFMVTALSVFSQQYKVKVNDGKYLYKITSAEKIVLRNTDSTSADPKSERIDRNHMLLLLAESHHISGKLNFSGRVETYTLVEEKVLDSGLEDFKEINSHLKGQYITLSCNKQATEIQFIDSVKDAAHAKSEYHLFATSMLKMLRPAALKNKMTEWKDSLATAVFQIPGFDIPDTCMVTYKVGIPFMQGTKKLYLVDYSYTHPKLSGYDKSSRSQGLDVTLLGEGKVKGSLWYEYETGLLYKATEDASYTFALAINTNQEPISKPMTFSYHTMVLKMEE